MQQKRVKWRHSKQQDVNDQQLQRQSTEQPTASSKGLRRLLRMHSLIFVGLCAFGWASMLSIQRSLKKSTHSDSRMTHSDGKLTLTLSSRRPFPSSNLTTTKTPKSFEKAKEYAASNATEIKTNTTYFRAQTIRRKLPSFANGGVMLFLHAPKTGGTTLRTVYGSVRDVWLEIRKSQEAFEKVQPLVEQVLRGDRIKLRTQRGKKVLFLELHDNYPGIGRLVPLIRKWREIAREHETGFFALTLVRDPLSYFVSFFNFFHLEERNFTWVRELLEPTDENVVSYSIPNHQCIWLVRDDESIDPPVSLSECDKGYRYLQSDFDWVGTTESLDKDTLPLLSHLTGHNHSDMSSSQSTKVAFRVQNRNNKVHLSSLREDSRQKLRERSTIDQEYVDAVRRDYPSLEVFENLPDSLKKRAPVEAQ